ncbi:signal peptidase I [Varibaculum massiliense]|uniref:signal peptidase I n=1 Tax=Varibaculum massiliense TaxID=1852372 RepID=UPI00288BF1B9|nr:signal peptidase I [Varibaculum massiliense]
MGDFQPVSGLPKRAERRKHSENSTAVSSYLKIPSENQGEIQRESLADTERPDKPRHFEPRRTLKENRRELSNTETPAVNHRREGQEDSEKKELPFAPRPPQEEKTPSQPEAKTTADRTDQSEKIANATSKIKTQWEKLRALPAFRLLVRIAEVIIVVSAIGILVATFFMSVLQIRGESMTPTLHDGDLVVASRHSSFQSGDIIAFYYNNKVLLKRVIGQPGDWIDMREDGTIVVNKKPLRENYVKGSKIGKTDIKFPYQVPEHRYFVLGDHRSISVDSRTKAIGTVSQDQIVGKALLIVWPLTNFDGVH